MAHIISADLPLVAQTMPGNTLRSRFAGGSGNAAFGEGTAAEGAESKAQNGMADLTKGLKTMENKTKPSSNQWNCFICF